MQEAFTFHGYTVYWSGWREPVNQLVRFGVWCAPVPASCDHPHVYVSTTLGHFDLVPEGAVLDLSSRDGWPTCACAPMAVFEEAQTRALGTLLEYLEKIPLR